MHRLICNYCIFAALFVIQLIVTVLNSSLSCECVYTLSTFRIYELIFTALSSRKMSMNVDVIQL